MPRIQRPYYNLHQIQTGQYTTGNEFVLSTGEVYIGPYHILPNGQRFTGFQPETNSAEIFEIRLNPTADILRYNQITGKEINRYLAPNPYYPRPSVDDYRLGWIERFFIQNRNSPINTIMEIDSPQYNSINTQNSPGINGVLWNKLRLEWKISKIPMDDAKYLNLRSVQLAEPSFAGISQYIVNGLEFYR